MTLNEWLMLDPAHQCDVPGCEFGASPYPINALAVRLCRGHRMECDRDGRDAFEKRNGADLRQLAAAYAEAFRQFYHAEVQRLRDELEVA